MGPSLSCESIGKPRLPEQVKYNEIMSYDLVNNTNRNNRSHLLLLNVLEENIHKAIINIDILVQVPVFPAGCSRMMIIYKKCTLTQS